MAPENSFLPTNGQGQRSIHLQQVHRCTPGRTLFNDALVLPLEMITPNIRTRMKQGNLTNARRVSGHAPRTLSKRARHACERQVFLYCRAAVRHRHNVIDMKCGFLSQLRHPAILAASVRAAHDRGTKARRYIHAVLAPDLARSLSSERNSAVSTRPSATFRSAAVSGVPESCWSRRDSSRLLTPAGSLKPAIPAGIGSSIVMSFAMADPYPIGGIHPRRFLALLRCSDQKSAVPHSPA